jgi:uncharacterized integral membrane protein (TIGR00698 family)
MAGNAINDQAAPMHDLPKSTFASRMRSLAPGLGCSLAIAAIAFAAAKIINHAVPIPPLVIALAIGIALNPIVEHLPFEPGIFFATHGLLRTAVALMGLRISLSDIVSLGLSTTLLVSAAMLVTLASGLLFARLFRQSYYQGLLAGAGTAVCGASAGMAIASILPDYKRKQADLIFLVVAVNTLSTIAMVLYPPFCAWLGLDQQRTGILLGATIHDVAQVVGAGYGVSETAGNAAVVVKLFRVLLLSPIVLIMGKYFSLRPVDGLARKAPVPVFTLAFVALCLLNSIAMSRPEVAPTYSSIKDLIVPFADWGLLTAISALGLSTSFPAMRALGWRPLACVVGATLTILIVVATGLWFLS